MYVRLNYYVHPPHYCGTTTHLDGRPAVQGDEVLPVRGGGGSVNSSCSGSGDVG